MTLDADTPRAPIAADRTADVVHDVSVLTILAESALPLAVRQAPITRVVERVLDKDEIDRLTGPQALRANDAASRNRLKTRRKALARHKGSTLTCAVIPLPGVMYTVEIDRESRTVVYWECDSYNR